MTATATLDIEDTVRAVKSGMETYLVGIIVGQGVIKCPILANPFFNKILYDVVEWGVDLALTKGGLLGFFINNKVISIDKGSDYIEAVEKVESLPDDVDNKTWEDAEREASEAFRNLYGLAR